MAQCVRWRAAVGVFRALLWPLVDRSFVLGAFYNDQRPGISVQAVRSLADQHGFQVASPSKDIVHVFDFQSLGKFSCTLRMQCAKMTEASFVFAD